MQEIGALNPGAITKAPLAGVADVLDVTVTVMATGSGQGGDKHVPLPHAMASSTSGTPLVETAADTDELPLGKSQI